MIAAVATADHPSGRSLAPPGAVMLHPDLVHMLVCLDTPPALRNELLAGIAEASVAQAVPSLLLPHIGCGCGRVQAPAFVTPDPWS